MNFKKNFVFFNQLLSHLHRWAELKISLKRFDFDFTYTRQSKKDNPLFKNITNR